MPTFREDLHLGHAVPTVDTDDITAKAITEDKMADDSISTRCLQDGSVTEPKLADGAVSTRTIQDGAVTAEKLADGSVHVKTLADDVYELMQGIEEHGIALAQDWGDHTALGISQKFLTDEIGEEYESSENTVKGRIKAIEDSIGEDDGEGTVRGRIKAIEDEIGDETGGEGTIKSRINVLEEAVGEGGSVDERIAEAKEEIVGDAAADYNTLGKVEDKIILLQDLYQALDQSNFFVLTASEWASKSSWETRTIYRVQGDSSYADYMWDGTSQQPTKMAEYDNAIDNEPTKDSENLVKSGGVYNSINTIDTILNGESALISKKVGVYLRGKRDDFTRYYATSANYTTYIHDVTSFVGERINFYISGITNSTDFCLLKDYLLLENAVSDATSADITDVLLVDGSNGATSTTKTSKYIDLTSENIVEHVNNGGHLYLITHLYNTYEPEHFYLSDGLVAEVAGKQDVLTFDNIPTENSNNPVKSSGLYNVLSSIEDNVGDLQESVDSLFDIEEHWDNQTAEFSFTAGSSGTQVVSLSSPIPAGKIIRLTFPNAESLINASLQLNFRNSTNNKIDNIDLWVQKTGGSYERTLTEDCTILRIYIAGTNVVGTGTLSATVEYGNYEIPGLLNQKQDKLTFDEIPTDGSDNVVSSGVIYKELHPYSVHLLKANRTAAHYISSAVIGESPVYSGNVYTNSYENVDVLPNHIYYIPFTKNRTNNNNIQAIVLDANNKVLSTHEAYYGGLIRVEVPENGVKMSWVIENANGSNVNKSWYVELEKDVDWLIYKGTEKEITAEWLSSVNDSLTISDSEIMVDSKKMIMVSLTADQTLTIPVDGENEFRLGMWFYLSKADYDRVSSITVNGNAKSISNLFDMSSLQYFSYATPVGRSISITFTMKDSSDTAPISFGISKKMQVNQVNKTAILINNDGAAQVSVNSGAFDYLFQDCNVPITINGIPAMKLDTYDFSELIKTGKVDIGVYGGNQGYENKGISHITSSSTVSSIKNHLDVKLDTAEDVYGIAPKSFGGRQSYCSHKVVDTLRIYGYHSTRVGGGSSGYGGGVYGSRLLNDFVVYDRLNELDDNGSVPSASMQMGVMMWFTHGWYASPDTSGDGLYRPFAKLQTAMNYALPKRDAGELIFVTSEQMYSILKKEGLESII